MKSAIKCQKENLDLKSGTDQEDPPYSVYISIDSLPTVVSPHRPRRRSTSPALTKTDDPVRSTPTLVTESRGLGTDDNSGVSRRLQSGPCGVMGRQVVRPGRICLLRVDHGGGTKDESVGP